MPSQAVRAYESDGGGVETWHCSTGNLTNRRMLFVCHSCTAGSRTDSGRKLLWLHAGLNSRFADHTGAADSVSETHTWCTRGTCKASGIQHPHWLRTVLSTRPSPTSAPTKGVVHTLKPSSAAVWPWRYLQSICDQHRQGSISLQVDGSPSSGCMLSQYLHG